MARGTTQDAHTHTCAVWKLQVRKYCKAAESNITAAENIFEHLKLYVGKHGTDPAGAYHRTQGLRYTAATGLTMYSESYGQNEKGEKYFLRQVIIDYNLKKGKERS
jgi:hypothetical protein